MSYSEQEITRDMTIGYISIQSYDLELVVNGAILLQMLGEELRPAYIYKT